MGKIKVKRKERYLRKVVESVPDETAKAEKEKVWKVKLLHIIMKQYIYI